MDGTFADDLSEAIALSLSESELRAEAKSSGSEDHDFALAVKLEQELEDELKTERNYSPKKTTQEDEDYALALKLSEDDAKAEPSAQFSQPKASAKTPSWDVAPGTCPQCRKVVSIGREVSINAVGHVFHRDCFRCACCSELIEGRFRHNVDQLYCLACAPLFDMRCYLCDAAIQGRFHKHAFFDTLETSSYSSSSSLSSSMRTSTNRRGYCPSHEDTQKPCYCCQRREPVAGSGKPLFTALPDGRKLCDDCVGTVVLDSETAKLLYLEALQFIRHSLGLRCPPEMNEVPVLAVDLHGMGEHRSSAAKNHHQNVRTQTLGLTLSTLTQVRHYGQMPSQVRQLGHSFLLPQMLVADVSVRRSVTAVLVLTGMPRRQMAGVLAHEAFHVWCSFNPRMPPQLPPKVEEGLCQLVKMRYLTDQLQSRYGHTALPVMMNDDGGGGDTNNWDYLLLRFLQHGIEINEDPVYGEGFRMAATSCNALGLDILLDHIAETSAFPAL